MIAFTQTPHYTNNKNNKCVRNNSRRILPHLSRRGVTGLFITFKTIGNVWLALQLKFELCSSGLSSEACH